MPKWLNEAIFYEIYPQSFYDSNGDGIGDLPGILQKLDYVQELGCNAIWLNPCFDSPFKDAGYDVRDYKKVAARYGTNEDLIALFRQAHGHGMHVLLDLVPGHTSEEHAWFRESQKAEKNQFSARYIWTNHCFEGAKGFPFIGGESERSGTYVLNFFKCQPALNYGFHEVTQPWQLPVTHPDCVATREALKNVMRFWLDRGCDGFRVDMADSLVKNDDAEKSGTSAVWRDVRAMLDEEYPEAALVSEWGVPELSLRAGFHMDFFLNPKFEGYRSLMRDYKTGEDFSFFKKNGRHDIRRFLDEYLTHYEATKDIGYFCPITCNHDTRRPALNLTQSELKLAYAFLFTLPGIPFLYYGDEIGMRYLELPTKEGGYYRTGSRSPMQWERDTANLGFSTAPTEKLYLPVDASADAPTVSEQEKNENSLYRTVQAILKLRREFPDLQAAPNFEVVYGEKEKLPFVYRRGGYLLAVNPSGVEQTVSLPEEQPRKTVYAIGRADWSGNALRLASQSFAIFR